MASQAVLELLIALKDQASAGLSSLGGALSNVGAVAGGVALAGIAAFTAGVVQGVGDAREAALTMAQTESVIKSTGGAAGVSAQQVADYAASLSAASGQSLFGDSQIQESTNLLLTFTNIKQKTLEAATAISVDMAQALGGAPKDAAIQLGKALNDPIAGVTALSKVGVSFTQEQKDQIRTMQEAGDMAGAQAIILAELNKEFGGSAKAAADADGGMAQFNDRMGEIFETLGAMLLPMLNRFASFLNTTVLPVVETQIVPAIASMAPALDIVGVALQVATDYFMAVLLPAAIEVGTYFMENIMPILTDIAKVLLPALGTALEVSAGIFKTVLLPALTAIARFIIDQVVPAIATVARWLAENLPPAIQKASDFFRTQILPAIQSVKDLIVNQLVPGISNAVKWLGDMGTKANDVAKTLTGDIKRGIDTLSKAFTETLTGAINGVRTVIAPMAGWFTAISDAIKIVIGLVDNFIKKLGEVKIPSWLQGHSPPPMADWFSYIADAATMASNAIPQLPSNTLDLNRVANAANSATSGSAIDGRPMIVRIELVEGTLKNLIRATIREENDATARRGQSRGRA